MNRTMKNELGRLAERFLDGLTSIAEEQRLKDLLSRGDVPQEYAELQAMFRWFAAGMVGEPPTIVPQRRASRRRTLTTMLSAAAGIAAAILLGYSQWFSVEVQNTCNTRCEQRQDVSSIQGIALPPPKTTADAARNDSSAAKRALPTLPKSNAKPTEEHCRDDAERQLRMLDEEYAMLQDENAALDSVLLSVRETIVLSELEQCGMRAVYMEDGTITIEEVNNHNITEL